MQQQRLETGVAVTLDDDTAKVRSDARSGLLEDEEEGTEPSLDVCQAFDDLVTAVLVVFDTRLRARDADDRNGTLALGVPVAGTRLIGEQQEHSSAQDDGEQTQDAEDPAPHLGEGVLGDMSEAVVDEEEGDGKDGVTERPHGIANRLLLLWPESCSGDRKCGSRR